MSRLNERRLTTGPLGYTRREGRPFSPPGPPPWMLWTTGEEMRWENGEPMRWTR